MNVLPYACACACAHLSCHSIFPCIVAVVEDEGRKEGRAMTNPGEGSL